MMFLRSVKSVFSGAAGFPEFAKRNTFRALFHLLLFCFLFSLICSGIQTYFISKKIDICTAGLEKQFGGIEISSEGICPEKNKEISWNFLFPGNMRLDYFAPGDKLTGKKMNEWEQRSGIIWGRRGFFVWFRPDASNSYYMMPFLNAEDAAKLMPPQKSFFAPVGQKEIEAELERYQEKPDVSGISASRYSFSEVGKTIKIYCYIVFTIAAALGNFALALVLILMFAGLQALWKAPGLDSLKFGKTVSLLCYTAFPALAIKMLLESLSFPGIAEVLFYIVFFIYQMVAFNEVRRSISGGKNSNEPEH